MQWNQVDPLRDSAEASMMPDMQDQSFHSPLRDAIESILPALERFGRFSAPEHIGRQRKLWSAQLEERLPQQGLGTEAVLQQLSHVVIPNGLRVGDTGFTGWMSMMPATLPVVTTLAATVAGPQRWWVQAFNTLEHVALGWLAELLTVPTSYQGIFSSGGAIANLVALTVARQAAAERLGFDTVEDGIATFAHPRFYVTSETHHIIHRAITTLGFGRRAITLIPTDDRLRMDVTALRTQIAQDRAAGHTPIAVIGTAGTTNTGSIDPLPELGQLCRDEGIWFHIDGAYGLLGIVVPEIAPLYDDLSLADSLVIDPHKWLNAPIGCGCTFVRDKKMMQRTFTLGTAAYLEEGQIPWNDAVPLVSQFADYGYQFHELGLELSAPSRGVHVWAILKERGVDGVRTQVQRNLDQARYLAQLVEQSPVLELVMPVTLSIGCFRYVPLEVSGRDDVTTQQQLNDLNRDILKRIQGRGHTVPSGTTVHGAFVIRPCYINPRASEIDVEMLVREVETCGAAAWANVRLHDETQAT